MKTLSIATDFSPSPAGRTRADGPFNGQRFRDDYLMPAIRNAVVTNDKVIVDLDGAYSYSSSFLEEVFGGLVRTKEFSPQDLTTRLEIKAGNPIYGSFRRDAQKYLTDALKLLGSTVAA
jgi:hypothetical protein